MVQGNEAAPATVACSRAAALAASGSEAAASVSSGSASAAFLFLPFLPPETRPSQKPSDTVA